MKDINRKDLLDMEMERIKQQIKLMDELSGLYAKQAQYIHDVNKNVEYRNKVLQKIEELERAGIKNIRSEADLDRERLDIDQKRLKIHYDIEDAIENINKAEEESFNNRIKRAKEYKKEQADIERLEKEADKRRQQIANQSRYKNAKDSTLNKAFANDNKLNSILGEIRQKKSDSATNDAMKEAIKSIKIGNSNLGKYVEANEKGVSTKAMVLQTVVDTFNKAVEVFASAVKKGFQNQTNAYEDDFTNIAVRTGMSQSTYRGNQMSLGGLGTNILHERGLMNNIRTSEVQSMWNSLANKGLSQEDILATSLEAVITKTIVPYLDVTSEELQQFNMTVGDNGLLKQVRGINKISQEEFGSSMTTQRYLQEALEYMSPMADAANLDLLKNTVGGVEMLQYLQSKEGGNLSTSAIAKLYRRSTQLSEDLMGSLQSGDLTTQLSAIGILQNGVNQYEDLAGVNNQSFIAQNLIRSMTPSNANLAAIFSSATGTNGTLNWEILKKSPDLLGAYNKGLAAAGRMGSASDSVTQSLANDEFHTTRQLTEILAENLTNEVSAFAEMLGPWFDVLTTLLKGIAGIIGVKVVGGIGKSILGKVGGGAGAGAGMSLGFNGMGAASGALGVTTAVAGIAGTAYGAYKTYEYGSQYAKSGKGTDLGATITAGAGTAAIAGGAITALTASGPVGWAIMAVGALGLVAADLIEDLGHDGDIMEELNKASEQRLEDFRRQHYEERKQLQQLRDDITTMGDTTDIQKQMIEEGIISQEELRKKQDELRSSSEGLKTEQELNKEALIALTDQFIATKASLDNTGEALLRDIENSQNAKQNNISKDIWELTKKKVEDMTDQEKAAVGDFMEDYYYWMKNKADSGDKDAKYRIDEWEKYGNNLIDHIVSQDDLNAVNSLNTTHYGDNDKTYDLYKSFMADANNVSSITRSTNIQKQLKLDRSYNREDFSQAINFVEQAILTKNEESAKSLLTQAKGLGLTWEMLGEYEHGKIYQEKLKEKGINSYRVGTNKIPYDNYPALLHEGEAVLTASTANELRGLIDEYRATKEDNIKITQTIENQTAVLVERLDAIYTKMPSGEDFQAQEMMPGKLNQNVRNMTTPFNQF